MSGPENPFAPPEAETRPGPDEGSEALRLRRLHLASEARLRALGSVFLVVGAVVLVWSASFLLIVMRLNPRAVEVVVPSVSLLVSLAFIALAVLLRRLEPRAFWPALTGGAVLLLAFPYGTPIGAYVLFALLQPSSRRVLTTSYAEVRRATPHVVYRTPATVWLLLGLVLVAFGALVLFLRR